MSPDTTIRTTTLTLMDLLPPHLRGNTSKKLQVVISAPKVKQISSPGSAVKQVIGSLTVTAPAIHGRSFSLRWSYGTQYSVGQMLILIDKEHYGAPLEVLSTFFPTEKYKKMAYQKDRYYLGHRKLGTRFLAGVIEIKTIPGEPLTYRMLYPSGQQIHDWKPLDLAKLRLRTTEEQRAHITAFTGIIYKAQETRDFRSMKIHKRKPDTFNTVMDAEFAKELEQLATKKPHR